MRTWFAGGWRESAARIGGRLQPSDTTGLLRILRPRPPRRQRGTGERGGVASLTERVGGPHAARGHRDARALLALAETSRARPVEPVRVRALLGIRVPPAAEHGGGRHAHNGHRDLPAAARRVRFHSGVWGPRDDSLSGRQTHNEELHRQHSLF